MVQYLVLANILDKDLFAVYLKGHAPSLQHYGGRVIFRSTANVPIVGGSNWDVIVLHEWPSSEIFLQWWHSEEYRPWAELRDKAARLTLIQCQNLL